MDLLVELSASLQNSLLSLFSYNMICCVFALTYFLLTSTINEGTDFLSFLVSSNLFVIANKTFSRVHKGSCMSLLSNILSSFTSLSDLFLFVSFSSFGKTCDAVRVNALRILCRPLSLLLLLSLLWNSRRCCFFLLRERKSAGVLLFVASSPGHVSQ
jgi:hypothetical protein